MAKTKTCRKCGDAITFRPWYRHAVSGRVVRASDYGIRAFRFCGCNG